MDMRAHCHGKRSHPVLLHRGFPALRAALAELVQSALALAVAVLESTVGAGGTFAVLAVGVKLFQAGRHSRCAGGGRGRGGLTCEWQPSGVAFIAPQPGCEARRCGASSTQLTGVSCQGTTRLDVSPATCARAITSTSTLQRARI